MFTFSNEQATADRQNKSEKKRTERAEQTDLTERDPFSLRNWFKLCLLCLKL
jgi:hypothetical protein